MENLYGLSMMCNGARKQIEELNDQRWLRVVEPLDVVDGDVSFYSRASGRVEQLI